VSHLVGLVGISYEFGFAATWPGCSLPSFVLNLLDVMTLLEMIYTNSLFVILMASYRQFRQVFAGMFCCCCFGFDYAFSDDGHN